MSETLANLLSDPWTYGILAGLGGLVMYYVRRRVAAGVDHRFALRLEEHKQSLRMTAEAAKYDFEEKLSRKTLYIGNAHAAAVEVYRAMREAHGFCLNLRGLTRSLTFEEFNEIDLTTHMDSRNVPKGKQEEVLRGLMSNREGTLQELKSYLRMLQVQEAERKLAGAKNLAYLNELYFDDEVVRALNGFFEKLDEWMLEIEFPPGPGEKRRAPTREQIHDALDDVQTLLRQRLAGDADSGPVTTLEPSGGSADNRATPL